MGISGIPDILLPAELSEIGDEHDLAYLRGGTRKDKWQADKRLFKRLKDRRHWLSLVLFPPFVLTLGWLPWHWKYRDRPMSDEELTMRRKYNATKKMGLLLVLIVSLNGCVSTLEYEGFRRVAFYQFGNESLEISEDSENVKLKYAAKKEPAWLGLEAVAGVVVGLLAAGM